MRVIKRSAEAFEKAVKSTGKFCKFVRIPSSKEPFFFTGLLMVNGVWIAWPDNLNDQEMDLYVERYGSPPDIFDLKEGVDEYLRVRNKDVE